MKNVIKGPAGLDLRAGIDVEEGLGGGRTPSYEAATEQKPMVYLHR